MLHSRDPSFIEFQHKFKYCPLEWRTSRRQFSSITIYTRVVGKMTGQHFNVLLFSNPGDKGPKKMENYRTKLSPIFNKNQDLLPGLENNDTLK